jgi:hypothetical protein
MKGITRPLAVTMDSTAKGIMNMRVGVNIKIGVDIITTYTAGIKIGVDISTTDMVGIKIGLDISTTAMVGIKIGMEVKIIMVMNIRIGMDISTAETVRRKNWDTVLDELYLWPVCIVNMHRHIRA